MTEEERKHKERLAELPCVLCFHLWGIRTHPVVLHHLRSGGWGKGDYTTLMPLCVEHHTGGTGVHGLGTKAFVRTYGITQESLLDVTQQLLKEL